MKIGIMTFFRPINYGAYLQAYALSHRLNQEKDIEAEIIDFRMPEEDAFYNKGIQLNKNIPRMNYNKKRSEVFHGSLKLQILSSDSLCTNRIEDFISFANNKYDVIISGSDEIWKVDGYRGFPTPYFLPGELHCKKISYAASGRTPFQKLSSDNQKLLKRYFGDFDYIGVRDLATFKGIEGIIDCNDKLHLNYDPSFVFNFHPDADKGRELIKKYFHLSGKKKIIGFMYMERLSATPNLERYLKKQYGKEFDFISLYEWSPMFKNAPQISPLEWVDIIAAVDGVISMYFHGVCFAIIAGTPFFAIEKRSPNDQESKLYDLLNRLGLLDYYSRGVENVIGTDKMIPFIKMVQKGMKIDQSCILNEAQKEFDDFVGEVRRIYDESNNE